MKQALIGLVLSLLIAGCSVAQSEPIDVVTSAPIAELSATPPPVKTLAPPPSATSTQIFLDATSTPTFTPTASTTPFPTLTPTAATASTRPPDIINDPSLPALTGEILMMWDPQPPEKVDGEYIGSFQDNFYQIIPGSTPTFHIIDAFPAYIPHSIYTMNVSPDQRHIALRLIDDTNENGQFDFSGYDTDKQTIHIYDVINETIAPFISAENSIPFISWTPDSQSILYPQGDNILLAGLDGSPIETLLKLPNIPINNISLSPNNRSLAIYTLNYQVQVYDLVLGEIIASTDDDQFYDMKKTLWSPDGSLLAFGQNGTSAFRPLSLFNADTGEFTVSVADPDDIVSIPSWSPDGQWLAFTTDQTTLSVWNRNDQIVTEILTGTLVSPPLWSPISNQLAVGIVNDNQGKLVVTDIDNENMQGWDLGDDIQDIRVLGWSPDGNWLAFIVQETDRAGLYIVPMQGENIYLLLDMVDDSVGNFVWVPTP